MEKIIFMGTPEFSVPILEALLQHEYDVIAVVTQPDRPVGRKKILTPSPVKKAALKHGLPVYQPEKISGSPEMEELIALNPDLIVTAAYGQFLPVKLLNAPRFRSINVHASLLPKYRGGAPVHYAIINGEIETGVSIMYMEKKMDAGAVLAQRAIPITEQDDVGTMFLKLSELGKNLLIETLPDFFQGNLVPQEQDESAATFSPNIKREEERIDWSKTAAQVAFQVRGMRPWPVAHTLLDGQRIKVWAGQAVENSTTHDSGTVFATDKEALYVACGEGTVFKMTELQPAGKKRMSAADYLRGSACEIHEGTRFETDGQ
ncbi:MAG TPA: methionyl-tRNA formyltransferase [Trichococcus sp.]|nr:methionyl-tRNA formyltransferase [Trichococcus sp.]